MVILLIIMSAFFFKMVCLTGTLEFAMSLNEDKYSIMELESNLLAWREHSIFGLQDRCRFLAFQAGIGV